MKKITADAHSDVLECAFDNNMNIRDRKLSFNLTDVKDNMPYLQLMACFVHDKYIDNGYNRYRELMEMYKKQEEEKLESIIRINTKKDIDRVRENNKLGVLLTVENAVAIDGNIDNLYNLYLDGIKMMTITWNYDNKLGCGNLTENDLGLTSLGKKCIKTMNNLNMIIDISHASVKTFWNIMSLTSKPIVASHSNAYNLCKHTRNLTDMQIKEIAKSKGIIGITYCTKFLTNNKKACINDVVNHIEYVCNLVGAEHVCLGSDFDGIDKKYLPDNLKGVKDIYKLKECLIHRGFNKTEIEKIMGENLADFIKNNI